MTASKNSCPPNRRETLLSAVVLMLLLTIAAGMLLLQARFDPAAWQDRPQAAAAGDASPETQTADDSARATLGLVPMSSVEVYDAVTLSDKIDGKAELYLDAGFQRLETRRFHLSDAPGSWLERFVYTMAGHRSAYAVYSTQYRPDTIPVELTGHGYRSASGLFLVHGAWYLEIIAADNSPPLQAAMTDLAADFVNRHGQEEAALPELFWFPQMGTDPGLVVLTARSAFGIEGLDWVFSRRYTRAAHEATAFVLRCDSAKEAGKLAERFHRHWRDYGGEEGTLQEIPMVVIMDYIEIAVVRNHILLGVHEATDRQLAHDLVTRLLAEAGRVAP